MTTVMQELRKCNQNIVLAINAVRKPSLLTFGVVESVVKKLLGQKEEGFLEAQLAFDFQHFNSPCSE